MRVSYRFRLLLEVIFAAALFASPVLADNAPPPTMTEADAAYSERADINKARMALEMYQKIIEADPASVEARWKGSRAAWWVGDQMEKAKDKINFFNLGIDLAKEGVRLDPNSVESHFFLGANYGSLGEAKGVLKSLFLVKPLRQEMKTVVRLNPQYDGGGGQRVLGVMDYKVPKFAGGDKKRAEQRLLESYALDPKQPYTIYYLGEYYATVRQKDRAKEYLNSLATLEVAPENAPDLEVLKKKAAELLSSF